MHVSQPYRSADTGQWVVSNSALVRDDRGAPLGIVRFELAARERPRDGRSRARAAKPSVQVAVVDRASGREILDTSHGVLAGGPGAHAGVSRAHVGLGRRGHALGGRAAARVPHADGRSRRPRLGRHRRRPPAVPARGRAASRRPSLVAARDRRRARRRRACSRCAQRRRDETRALLEAEGGRAEAERRSRTDALTGLYNRRHVLDCDRGRARPLRAHRRAAERAAARSRPLPAHQRRLRPRRRRSRAERGRHAACRAGCAATTCSAAGAARSSSCSRPACRTTRRCAGSPSRSAGSSARCPVAIDDETLLPVTVSVGAVRAGDALRSVEGLVDCADRALAAAKRRGRDRVQLFGDLTVEDLVAEEPEPIRLARALALSSSARADLPHVDAERVSELAVAIAEQMRARRGRRRRAAGSADCYMILAQLRCADRILALVGPPTAARPRWPTRGTPRRRRAPRAQRRGRQRRRRHRRRARGVVRRHRLPGGPERRRDPAREPHRRLRRRLREARADPRRDGSGAVRSSGRPGSALDPEVVRAALALLAREAPARRAPAAATCRAAPAPYPRRDGLPAAPQPAADRADRDPQSHRLDGAPDDARRGRPADRRLRRLPRGARRGRRRADLHRGHGGAPERAADGPHDRGLRPARRRAAGARRRRRARGRQRGSSRSSSTAAASRSTPRRARPRSRRRRCRASASRSSRARSARARSRRSSRTTSSSRAMRATAGLDGIELCASHGYLPTQFLSERTNRRDDAWGGDAERRLHYVREALRAMRRGGGAGTRGGHPALGRRDAARGPPRAGDRGHPAHARRRGADRLRERRDRRLGELPRLGLDRAAAADRARCRCASPRAILHEAARGAADRHLAHPRAGRGRGAAGRGRRRRRRHDARADRRSRPAAAHRRGARGRAHPLHRLQPGLHRPLPPRACRSRACRTRARGARRTLPEPAPQAGTRVLVVGGGPAGMAAAVAPAAPAPRSRWSRPRLRWAASSRSPAARPRTARRRARYQRRLGAPAGGGGRRRAPGHPRRRPTRALASGADRVIVATGARRAPSPAARAPGRRRWSTPGMRSARPARVAGPVLVADWGGGWTGLDAAETLAEAGLRVWLAVAAPLVGETVHQYQRVFYLARLERLGVTILHHRELADARRRAPSCARSGRMRPSRCPPACARSCSRSAASPSTGSCAQLGERGIAVHARGRLPRARARSRRRSSRARRPASSRRRCSRCLRRRAQEALSGSPERSSVACASSRISSVMSRLAL